MLGSIAVIRDKNGLFHQRDITGKAEHVQGLGECMTSGAGAVALQHGHPSSTVVTGTEEHSLTLTVVLVSLLQCFLVGSAEASALGQPQNHGNQRRVHVTMAPYLQNSLECIHLSLLTYL